jgi:DNA-binding LacI/PurR family transcriptional regulator
MAPTIREVAREAGVSIATVSHALSGKRPVSRRTRSRIAKAVERLGYRPNPIAAAMTTGRTQTLGVVVPDIANPFFGELLAAVERTAARHGYSVLASSSELGQELEARAVQALQDRRVDAVIYLPWSPDPTAGVAGLVDGGTRLVWLDEELAGIPEQASVLIVDNVRGGALAAEHLRTLGHTRAGIIAGPLELPTARQRVDGFQSELPDSRPRAAAAYTVPAGRMAALDLLTKEPQLTALFCANDLIALGALAAARELGRDVPADLSLVGFDDSFLASAVTPALTTVRQPLARLGKEAAEVAIELAEGTRHEPVRRTLPVELVVRESTAPVAAGVTTSRRIA